MAVETAPNTQYQSPPATEKQLQTIARFHRSLAVPKREQRDTAGMTRADASEYISSLIQRMQSDEDETPSPAAQVGPAIPASEITGTHPVVQQATAAARALPGAQGEWPAPPPQSSERDPQQEVEARAMDAGAGNAVVRTSTVAPTPTTAPVRDDPFAAPQGESWADLGASQLGDEDDEIDLERAKLAPAGIPLGFQVISSEKKQAGPSGYPGILVTAKVVAGADGTELGGTATEYLSLSPNARWKLDQFLDACNAPPEGKINYRQFVGWTFWAQAKRDDYTKTTDSGDTQVTPKCVIDKYLEGPKIDAPKLNGTAPREKVKAQLGAEFDSGTPF
jgi:hypothetical protein